MTSSQKTSKSVKLVINEVDCYIGNATIIKEYATDRSVQHQIMLMIDGREVCIGRRNGVADSDRGERIVYEKTVDARIVDLFEQANQLKRGMRSEYCDSAEEYNEAAKYNEPIKAEVTYVIERIYDIENLNIPFKVFNYHINY